MRLFGDVKTVRIFTFVLASFVAIWTCKAHALDIVRQANVLHLSGEIEELDDQQFAIVLSEALLELHFANDRTSPIYVHLDIPSGGVADVALNIADIILSTADHGNSAVITVVETDKTCTSGCTFIFLSGTERWAAGNARFLFHGFDYAKGSVAEEHIRDLTERYKSLANKADPRFLEFIEWAGVIEKDRNVGFTGKTLFEHSSFSNLVTKLIE